MLEPAPAEDKDSLNVTAAFAKENGVKTIADLAKVNGLRLAANPEFKQRAYGIPGLEKVYGIKGIAFTPISDGGGPATVKALVSGKVDVADIYSTTPSIAANKLVTLDDPKNLIAAQNVIPLIREEKATDEVTRVLNAVSAALTTEELLELNEANQGKDKKAPATLGEGVGGRARQVIRAGGSNTHGSLGTRARIELEPAARPASIPSMPSESAMRPKTVDAERFELGPGHGAVALGQAGAGGVQRQAERGRTSAG